MNPFFAFPLYVMYIILFYHIFLNINLNMKFLEKQILVYRDHFDETLLIVRNPFVINQNVAGNETQNNTGSFIRRQQSDTMDDNSVNLNLVSEREEDAVIYEDNIEKTPAYEKMKLFRRTKQLLMLFIIAYLGINILVLSLHLINGNTWAGIRKYRWAEKTMRELTATAIALAIMFIWRLRGSMLYYITTFSTQPIIDMDMNDLLLFAHVEVQMNAQTDREQEEENTNLILNLAKPPSYMQHVNQDESDRNWPVLLIQNPYKKRNATSYGNENSDRQHIYPLLALEQGREPPIDNDA
jgi:hypothetical protein